MRLPPRPALVSVLALGPALAGCTDFATPNQLERPTIIAVVAEPPIVRPGREAVITVVTADRTGVLADLPTRWEVGEAFPGVPPMGTVRTEAGRAIYTAPDPVPVRPDDVPPLDSIMVTVDTADGPRTAIKAMPVLPMDAANPTLTALAVGAGDGLAGPVTVQKGATVALSVTIDPPAGDDTTFAWYTPVGDIKFYQSNPCELVVPPDAASGPLMVVVRDGKGGVVWRDLELRVE